VTSAVSSVTRLYPASSQYPTHLQKRTSTVNLVSRSMFNCSMQHDAGLLLLQLRFVSFRLWTEQEARQVTRAERLP